MRGFVFSGVEKNPWCPVCDGRLCRSAKTMSATAYLYRRNGTYYFRWAIPLACRQRMPPGSPSEIRLSLGTANPLTARHDATRFLLAALDVSKRFLVSHRSIQYNHLVIAIKGRARMPTGPEANLVALGVLAGSTDPQPLKDLMAHLDAQAATFHVAIDHTSAALWDNYLDADGTRQSKLVERINDFADANAILTRESVVQALAAKENLLSLPSVRSNLPGMWQGTAQHKRYLEVRFDTPIVVNLSAIKVDSELAKSIPRAQASPATAKAHDTSCAELPLKDGLDMWLKSNADWSAATKANYRSYVQQFISIVGNLKTTELTAQHFTTYDSVSRRLPKNWRQLHEKTGKSLQKIAEEANDDDISVSVKSLKEKGATIALFFGYLEGQGYWHGKFGKKLFAGLKAKKGSKTHRPVLTKEELNNLFTGDGFPIFQKAKFALYVWGSVLLLYTGARPAEISQLKHEDIIKDTDGTWYLKITDSEDDTGSQKVKTEASKRSVPLHSEIIKLGFLDYVDQFQDGQYLFPEAFRHKQKVSRELGDWFNAQLLPATPLKEKDATLYSLRHTVIERFKADATLDYLACAYTGHRTDEDGRRASKVFSEVYGRAHQPSTLATRLHPLLDFGIDWSEFKKLVTEKNSAWAVERQKLEMKKAAKTAPVAKKASAVKKTSVAKP